jgi:uncharacterized protein YwbE
MFFLLIFVGALAAPAIAPAAEANSRVTPGTFTIEPADAATAPQTEPAFVDAVQAAIMRAGFTPLPMPSHSRYIATVTVTHTMRGTVTSGTRSRAAVGVRNWGTGLAVGLPKKDDQLHGLIVTELKVTFLTRSDNHPVWSGSAVTAQVDGTRAGAPEAVAGKLTDALFAQFPRRLPAPVSVP